MELDAGAVNQAGLPTVTLTNGIAISSGDMFKLTGTNIKTEWARINFVEFTPQQ